MPTNGDRKIRMSVDLSPRSYERLERLREAVGAQSKADVLRDALQIYEWVVQKTQGGGEFFVRERDGEPQQVVVLGIDR